MNKLPDKECTPALGQKLFMREKTWGKYSLKKNQDKVPSG